MKIGFLGFGNMAQAMAGGLVRSGAVQPGDIGACARDRAKLRRNTEPQGFRAFDDAAAVAEFADLVVVAVKPYQVEAVLAPVREQLADKIVVSVAAGVTFDLVQLSSVIYVAMVTTVMGLIVGIPAYFGYNYLVARIEKLVFQMEANSIAFMDILNQPVQK